MVPSHRLNFVPTQFSSAPLFPGPNWSMLPRPASNPLPDRDHFRAAFLALPWDPKHYEAADRLAQQLSIGSGAVSKQMVKLSFSYGSPDGQEDFWNFLEDIQGVKVPWKAGATLTWRIHKQADWIHFELWGDTNLF